MILVAGQNFKLKSPFILCRQRLGVVGDLFPICEQQTLSHVGKQLEAGVSKGWAECSVALPVNHLHKALVYS